jgi:hypothetical protein
MGYKKVFESLRREELYNILMEFEILMELVRLIKICLNKTHNRVRILKYLSDNFPAKMV